MSFWERLEGGVGGVHSWENGGEVTGHERLQDAS